MARARKKVNSIVLSGWNAEGTQMWFYVSGHKRETFNRLKAHEKCNIYAMLEGWTDRLVDAAAVGKSDKDGNLIPDKRRFQLMHDRMCALRDHYETGTDQWNLRQRTVSTPDMRDEWTRQAIGEAYKWDSETVEKKLAAQSTKRNIPLKTLLESYRTTEGMVRAIYVRIRDAAETASGDGGELLDELEELEIE